jgi:hypothetical protein
MSLTLETFENGPLRTSSAKHLKNVMLLDELGIT